ncbi:MAG: galactose-1-phosphate uridylyltransferase, partial [Clostridia bacterium]|nr:galactose-1-phosphate uridylyltransferase [Clostridia bacterium]
NRGEVVGVTMPHPHGQIYGYSVIPKKLELEMDACKEHFDETHSCLYCDMLEDEKNDGRRIIIENDDFVAYLPFYSEYPYGMYIGAKRHIQNLSQMTDSEKDNLAKILKETTGTLDSLFDYAFPYMMCMYQNPVNGEDVSDYYHFHIAFYPPMRSADKVKFNASSETGAWAHCNTTAPEAKAEELRAAHEKFLKKMNG